MRGGVRANLDAAGRGDLSYFSFSEAHFRTPLPDNYCTVPNSLNDDQMKELTSWIFSTQEANEVEMHIRSCLLEPPRVTSTKERRSFAKHLLCEEQKANFQLWPVRTSVNISDFEGKKH